MGLMDDLNSAVGQGMDSPLFALGMGLIGGAQPFANPAEQIQGARSAQLNQQTTQQNLRMQQYGMQMMQQSMPAVMQMLTGLGLMAGPPGQQPGASPAQAGGLMAPGPQPSGATTYPLDPSAAPGGQGLLGAPQGQSQGAPPQQGGIDPNQAARASLGLSMLSPFNPVAAAAAPALDKYAAYQQANDPRLVTQRAAASSQLAQDQYNIQQAKASGDKTALTAATMRYLTDAKAVDIANNNNAVTTFGGITPEMLGMSASNPGQGTQTIGGVQSAIPGAPQTQEQLAGAKAKGEAQGELQELTDTTGGITGQKGAKYYVPKSTLLGGSSGAVSQPGAATGPRSVPPLATQGPEQAAQQTAAGEKAGEELGEFNKNADAARQANYTLDQLRALGKGVTLGPGAPAKEWLEQVATPLAQAFGMQPPGELGSYQQINKFGNTLAFNAARAMGSREAAQIVQMQVQSNPNKGLVSDAYNGLIDSMSAMNNYVLAKNNAVQAAATGGQITARQAIANWETQIDPKVWDLAVSPALASRFAGQIGANKIAQTLPFMASPDAISTMRNISPTMQAQVLRGLPPAAKQEILSALQGTAQSGATGTF